MNTQKLKDMISATGSARQFAQKVGISNSTIATSLSSDERLGRMPIDNFIKIAHELGMTADELVEALSD